MTHWNNQIIFHVQVTTNWISRNDKRWIVIFFIFSMFKSIKFPCEMLVQSSLFYLLRVFSSKILKHWYWNHFVIFCKVVFSVIGCFLFSTSLLSLPCSCTERSILVQQTLSKMSKMFSQFMLVAVASHLRIFSRNRVASLAILFCYIPVFWFWYNIIRPS